MEAKKEACKTFHGLFRLLRKNLIPQHNETILSFQYCKLSRKCEETAEEWMEKLNVKAAECNYTENVRHLKEQFINRLNDDDVMAEIKEILRRK